MKKMTKIVKFWGGVAQFISMAVLVSCSDDKNTNDPSTEAPEESEKPEVPDTSHEIDLDELIGAWEAEGYRWDLDEGKSICYQMTDDGQDFATDDLGNYITLPSIRAYCEQYANDYNADPENEIKGTPEDFANHEYEGSYLFTNINITEDKIVIYSGQQIPEQGTLAILCVSGAYTYDKTTGTFTVEDLAIESDPRTLAINVTKDENGRMNFRYSDYDMYTTPSYDRTKTYYVYAPMIFFCHRGSAYEPKE